MTITIDSENVLAAPNKHLTVSQAKKLLANFERHGFGDKILVIGAQPHSASRGMSISTEITGFQAGVAWDEDKVFVHTAVKDNDSAETLASPAPRYRPAKVSLAELLSDAKRVPANATHR